MTSDLTDAEILRLSLSEPIRFEVIYERHLASVYRYIRRRVGDDVAEDLTAEVFVRAFRDRSRFNAQYLTCLPWVFGIANNLVGDQRRVANQRLRTLERLASEAARKNSMASDEVYFGTTVSPEIYRAVRKLAAGDRDALLLVAWGELSYDETAQALGIPVGTVRSRIARARKKLQKTIGTDFRTSSALVAERDAHA